LEKLVTATPRRAFSTLLLATLLAAAGSMLSVGAASAAPRPITAGSATPGAPGGTVQVLGEHFIRDCVKNFKPHSTVTVVNESNGATVKIHTDGKGNGCASLPLKHACQALTQQLVATGIGSDGKPATVRQTMTAPATKSLCRTSSGGTLPFTGSNIIVPGVIIGVVLIVVGAAMSVVRRRRGFPAN
jgi:hypothetical protein